MNPDFHFYGTGTAALSAGLTPYYASIIANAAEFVDLFASGKTRSLSNDDSIVGDPYSFLSEWCIIDTSSGGYTEKFQIKKPQLTAQHFRSCYWDYSPDDYWVPFHFPPGNTIPQTNASYSTGEFKKIQDRYLDKFSLRRVNPRVKDGAQICRPYSQFAIDMLHDTMMKVQEIRNGDLSRLIPNYVFLDRYVGDKINSNTNIRNNKEIFALIFLGIRMHILADTWAHQDFFGYADNAVNRIISDVYADDQSPSHCQKVGFAALPFRLEYYRFIGSMLAFSSFDNDYVYAPVVPLIAPAAWGHGNMGHFPDYGWLNIDYRAAWQEDGADLIHRDNPKEYQSAWNEMAAAIKLCWYGRADIEMPPAVAGTLAQRFSLSNKAFLANKASEAYWSSGAGKALHSDSRWSRKPTSIDLGIHSLGDDLVSSARIEDGSIIHMYELAALIHYTWFKCWIGSCYKVDLNIKDNKEGANFPLPVTLHVKGVRSV